jgi:hypothetical protein
MITSFKKNLSLIATIAVILIVAIGGYYLVNLRQGPYPVASFVSLSYKWGVGDSLVNTYDSNSGTYQYLDNRDSLRKTRVKLNANNVIFLHNKANEIGLWELPDVIGFKSNNPKDSVLRYEIVFKYEKKTKKIVYYTNSENADVAFKATKLQEIVAQTIKEASERNPGL